MVSLLNINQTKKIISAIFKLSSMRMYASCLFVRTCEAERDRGALQERQSNAGSFCFFVLQVVTLVSHDNAELNDGEIRYMMNCQSMSAAVGWMALN